MNTQNIYNLIILDASGSMSCIHEQALAGVNETIATIRLAQKEHPEMPQFLTLASFSSGDKFLNRIYTAKPIDKVRDITLEDYPLLGCTALYDAMGTTITQLQKQITADDRVLVTIITDGYENASCIWSGEQIKSLVEELRQTGWTFTYIGADQDVEKVAGSIGVRHSLKFSRNPNETREMFNQDRQSRKIWYGKMSAKIARGVSTLSEEDDYFNPNAPREERPQEAAPRTQYEPQPHAKRPEGARTQYEPQPHAKRPEGARTQYEPQPHAKRPEGARKSFFERLFGKKSAITSAIAPDTKPLAPNPTAIAPNSRQQRSNTKQ